MKIDPDVIETVCATNDIAVLRFSGSARRGQNAKDSDLDLLVEFNSPKSLLDLVGIQQEFEESWGGKWICAFRRP